MVCDSVVIMLCGNIVFMRYCGDYCVFVKYFLFDVDILCVLVDERFYCQERG